MRNTMVLPGRSSNCCELKTRLLRPADPCTAKRVPSASVNETSWLRVNCGPTRPARISPSE